MHFPEKRALAQDCARLTAMKKAILFVAGILLLAGPAILQADQTIYLNAFGETATAYLNDSFLLLGTTADGFVADIIPKETALEIARNVQKRVRLIRAKLKAVSNTKIADVDGQLIGLLDNAFACLDHQAWTLTQYIEDKSPDNARKFESQRTDCLSRLKKISDFYMALPPSPEVPEPLSTR
jgi:hypothetical protein